MNKEFKYVTGYAKGNLSLDEFKSSGTINDLASYFKAIPRKVF